jgi:aarF domain-containing kinase
MPPLLRLPLRPPSLPLLSPPCLRYQSTSLTSRLLPKSLARPPTPPKADLPIRKTKPLPISPSPRRRPLRTRLLLYAAVFAASGLVTFTTLQPDNTVTHAFHGVVRCSRVTVALARCVWDYRRTMKRQAEVGGEEGLREMSLCHTRCAQRALNVFERNGGIYIKLGQHLAALSYLIPIVPPTSPLR